MVHNYLLLNLHTKRLEFAPKAHDTRYHKIHEFVLSS